MGSFAKECGHLMKMKGSDALRLKKEIMEKQKIQKEMQQAADNISLMAAKRRAKRVSEEIRRKIFD